MTNSTAINYQALREIAKQATQGEWVAFISPGKHGTYAVHTPGDNHHGDIVDWPGFDGQKNAENNARYIAAFNPEVVQALLNEREAQSKRIAELEASRAALAAENALARKAVQAFCEVVGDNTEIISELVGQDGVLVILKAMKATGNMSATDAFLAEIRAEARNEGINYTASRLAAAFNHGFINKSLREVFDVTRMILSAKEELANEPHPIDGLSGEYAEKSLEEWAEQIRKGGDK
ncbi:ead/Ea22-like family protein [Escherichia coli]|uniref:ead/Ea22-like family protein n=1 Tax=Escherichia coli TaxID=562 RepID=UPI00122E5683|nr:ead/Ea22-like family protein [Escherichia coli]EHA5609957.1 ead/Ea22-like family protein [Escherichia coli]KAA1876117.1 ead/Ea22-like family protein [Escherichia coli]MBJ7121360.1 ead/Ea22-like family protein [Escherichia coli]MBV4748204.1 ead/Ea22-like family protein [Escherichia coli]MBV4748268.1 ead/Ea22-like family protein [Escherichia coli]